MHNSQHRNRTEKPEKKKRNRCQKLHWSEPDQVGTIVLILFPGRKSAPWVAQPIALFAKAGAFSQVLRPLDDPYRSSWSQSHSVLHRTDTFSDTMLVFAFQVRVVSTHPDQKPTRSWERIAAEITREADSQKLMILLEELDRALAEREAWRDKLTPSRSPLR